MYFRLRLSANYQTLYIFDIKEEHNHPIDPNTCIMAPRQQIYKYSKLRNNNLASDQSQPSYTELLASTLKDGEEVCFIRDKMKLNMY